MAHCRRRLRLHLRPASALPHRSMPQQTKRPKRERKRNEKTTGKQQSHFDNGNKTEPAMRWQFLTVTPTLCVPSSARQSRNRSLPIESSDRASGRRVSTTFVVRAWKSAASTVEKPCRNAQKSEKHSNSACSYSQNLLEGPRQAAATPLSTPIRYN